jgi:hypothetical protein
MIYVGYNDPLPSQLKKIMEGAKIDLDNKALEAFKLKVSPEDCKEVSLSEVFPCFGKTLASLEGNEAILSILR